MTVFNDRPLDDIAWGGRDMPENEQLPRHTIVAEQDGDDLALMFECPFGNDTYLSLYPTVEDRYIDTSDHLGADTWPPLYGFPQHVGHLVEGYCSKMGAWTRPIYRYRTRGVVLEVQHVATMGCRIAFEIEQVGLEEMLGDQLIYMEGIYPVTFWEEGSGEFYETGLNVEHWARAPLR